MTTEIPEKEAARLEPGDHVRPTTDLKNQGSEHLSVVNWTDAASGKITASLWSRVCLKAHFEPGLILRMWEHEPLALTEADGRAAVIVHPSSNIYGGSRSFAPALSKALSLLSNRPMEVRFIADGEWSGSADTLYQGFLEQLVWLYPRAVWMRKTSIIEHGTRLEITVPENLFHRTRHKIAAEYLQRLEDCWLSATGRAVIAYFNSSTTYE
jgi:hypothetical protein